MKTFVIVTLSVGLLSCQQQVESPSSQTERPSPTSSLENVTPPNSFDISGKALKGPGQMGVPLSICGGTVDFQDVELYDGTLGVTKQYVETHEPSTVQFRWLSSTEIEATDPTIIAGNISEVRWCTGTLLSDNRVLTAAHCFEPSTQGWQTPQKLSGELLNAFELAPLQTVIFEYQKNGNTSQVRPGRPYAITELLEYGFDRAGGLDYAIVRVGADANGNLPSGNETEASISMDKILNGDQVTILQHPAGEPKKVESGSILGTNNVDVYYKNLDTLGGSSGSSVRDDNGNIVAVHTNGGCTEQPNSANRGVSILAIAPVSNEI